MPTGYLFMHGTGQDIMSTKESTVTLERTLKDAGELVRGIGGPGSSERAIKISMENDYLLRTGTPPSIDEIHFPTDYLLNLVSGTVRGKGTREIVKEAREALQELVSAGATTIKIIGFSRGAVAAAMLLVDLNENGKPFKEGTQVDVALLDPVPGPYSIPQSLTVPRWVNKLYLQVSQHESRIGFQPLDIIVESTKTTLVADLCIGVHGDIGGSRQNSLSALNLDSLKTEMDINVPKLDYQQFTDNFIEVLKSADFYINPGIFQELRNFQGMDRRPFGGLSAGLTVPSALLLKKFLDKSPGARQTLSSGSVQPGSWYDPAHQKLNEVLKSRETNGQTLIYKRPPSYRAPQGRIIHPPKFGQPIKIPKGGNALLKGLAVGVMGAIAVGLNQQR